MCLAGGFRIGIEAPDNARIAFGKMNAAGLKGKPTWAIEAFDITSVLRRLCEWPYQEICGLNKDILARI